MIRARARRCDAAQNAAQDAGGLELLSVDWAAFEAV